MYENGGEGWTGIGLRYNWIRRGWAGLLNYNPSNPSSKDEFFRHLTRQDVRIIDRTGGTFLHTSRTNPQNVSPKAIPDFLINSGKGKYSEEKETWDFTDHVLEVIDHLGIDMLVVIGGDDTLSYAARLNREHFPVVAIPKTMDNECWHRLLYRLFHCGNPSVEFSSNLRTSGGSHDVMRSEIVRYGIR